MKVGARACALWPASLAACLLGGCAVGPDYSRPALPIPSSYENVETPGAAEADFANTACWSRFDDPVIDALIAEALRHNRSARIATANVEQAAALLGGTRSAFLPQVGYDAEGSRQGVGSDPGVIRYATLASASWEIDLWGRIRRQTEAARAGLLASREARRGVILSLVGQVAGQYLQLRALDEQLEVARETLANHAESLRLFELQFEHGVASQMNIAQARSQYETAAAQIPLVEQQIGATENALCVLLGRPPGRIERGKVLAALNLPLPPAGLPSELLERRPDIAQSEQELIAANAQIGAARALMFPALSLTGALGTASPALSGLFEGPSRTWTYQGSVTGPLFTGGAVTSQVREAEAAQRAALAAYELTVQTAFADVENALEARRKVGERLAAQQRLVEALAEYSELARAQYSAGYVPYSTVLQAQQQLFPAELALAQQRADLHGAAVGIYLALGGGWIEVAEGLVGSPAGLATVAVQIPGNADFK